MTNKVVTLGCRLNHYESGVIKEILDNNHHDNTVVVNTCAVTAEAERQAKQTIRRLKKEHPNKKIIVTGCSAQIKADMYSQMNEVDQVLGNSEKLEASYYSDHVNDDKVQVNDIMSVTETASHMVSSFDGKTRAFVQIQNGCNHRCTFCIIPYGRGNSRSVPIGEIAQQLGKLVDNGYHEIVLTGVDISDYGLDLPGKPSLAQMLRRVLAAVPKLTRIRLSSIDVAEIDEELFNLFVNEKRIMPHIHISLQAGDNMILKRMKRRHTREQVVEFCHKLKALRPDVAYGADIIAGFPTETDEMFDNTLKLVKEAGLSFLHVFPYSERDGTPAAKMPQVDGKVRKQRAKLLREEGQVVLRQLQNSLINGKFDCIIENNNIARSEHFYEIEMTTPISDKYIGTIQSIHVTHSDSGKLFGTLDR